MEINGSSMLQAIDESILTPVIRRSLRRDAFQIRDWHARQLGGGAGNPVSVGLYRFEGTGQDCGEQVAWSVILKIVQSPANVGWQNMGEGEDQTHWNYWRRELLVYPSGLLDTLPRSMAVPRCFGIVERPDHVAWLWLEDIVDALGGIWSLDRYALTARHLGQLNGLFAMRPMPGYPWLGNNLTQQWITDMRPSWQELPWDHPRVLARYPKNNFFHKLLVESEHFQTRLNLLPRTICHGDTYPTNFMVRHLGDGQEQTVALDWALMNIGPVGDDLGQFVFGAHTNLGGVNREDITRALFDSYVAGLRDSGCQLDQSQVRFGFTATAALRVGLFQVFLMNEELKQNNSSAVKNVEPSVEPDCFEVMMAREAYGLLDTIQ
jgi:hypothetical protein